MPTFFPDNSKARALAELAQLKAFLEASGLMRSDNHQQQVLVINADDQEQVIKANLSPDLFISMNINEQDQTCTLTIPEKIKRLLEVPFSPGEAVPLHPISGGVVNLADYHGEFAQYLEKFKQYCDKMDNEHRGIYSYNRAVYAIHSETSKNANPHLDWLIADMKMLRNDPSNGRKYNQLITSATSMSTAYKKQAIAVIAFAAVILPLAVLALVGSVIFPPASIALAIGVCVGVAALGTTGGLFGYHLHGKSLFQSSKVCKQVVTEFASRCAPQTP